MSIGVDPPALFLNRRGESGQILQRMKLRLLWKPQRCAGVVVAPGNALDFFNFSQSGTMCRRQFVVQNFLRLARRNKQVAVNSLKLAVDRFRFDYLFDFVDRRRMTLCGVPRAFFAMQLFEFEITIVKCVN